MLHYKVDQLVEIKLMWFILSDVSVELPGQSNHM